MSAADADDRVIVVVANTDPVVCEVLGRIVEAGGHEAVRVELPARLLGAVHDARAAAVVLDLGADNVDQLVALRTDGHDHGSGVAAVVVSSGPANSALAWQADADAVLARPFAARDLQQALVDVMGRSDEERLAVRASEVRSTSA